MSENTQEPVNEEKPLYKKLWPFVRGFFKQTDKKPGSALIRTVKTFTPDPRIDLGLDVLDHALVVPLSNALAGSDEPKVTKEAYINHLKQNSEHLEEFVLDVTEDTLQYLIAKDIPGLPDGLEKQLDELLQKLAPFIPEAVEHAVHKQIAAL